MAIVVGHSAVLKLQVVTGDLQTTWKASPAEGSGWTPWQAFPALPASANLALPAWELAATQLPAINPNRELRGNRGRLQLWGLFFNASNPSSAPSRLFSTIKSSEHLDAPWGPWTDARIPAVDGLINGTIAVVYDFTVAQLKDGRLQLWASFTAAGAGQNLWSSVMTGPAWNDPWSSWQKFNLPGDPGFLIQFAAAQLPNGDTQLWALGDALNGQGFNVDPLPWTVYTTSRSANAAANNDPQTGWSPWTVFAPWQGQAFPKAQGLQTAVDGAGRAYLWAAVIGKDVEPPLQWKYIYSNTASGPGSTTWSPLTNQDFPIPAPTQNNPQNDGGTRALSAAPLPDGNLQLFYYPQGQQGGPAPVVSTRWQQLGQAPTSWTSWQTPFQP